MMCGARWTAVLRILLLNVQLSGGSGVVSGVFVLSVSCARHTGLLGAPCELTCSGAPHVPSVGLVFKSLGPYALFSFSHRVRSKQVTESLSGTLILLPTPLLQSRQEGIMVTSPWVLGRGSERSHVLFFSLLIPSCSPEVVQPE